MPTPIPGLLISRRVFGASILGAAVPWPLHARQEPTAAPTSTGMVLSNGLIERRLTLPGAASRRTATEAYHAVGTSSRLFAEGAREDGAAAADFGFRVDGVLYGSATSWLPLGTSAAQDPQGGSGIAVRLADAGGAVEVTATYLMYPGSPAMRKLLTVRNRSSRTVALEDVDVESFAVSGDATTYGWIYSDYGRRKSIGPFAGGRQDSLVALHDPDSEQGLVLGSEAPGVNKYIGFCDVAPQFVAGLSRSSSDFPFRRWLKPGASYTAPAVFSIAYAGVPRFETVLNTSVPDFVRKHMGTRLSQFPGKPTFVYNTWEPFQKDINEALIRELASKAAAAGVETFVIDDGWQDTYGDWNVDRVKFPNGLKPVTDYIKSLGMKPGLWLSIGSASEESKVFRAHPEWFARNQAGQPYSVHRDADVARRMTACMSTGWKTYIQDLLSRLTVEHGLEYLKLDFAIVTSPYQFDPVKTGCYAKSHGHVDHRESLSVNYDRLWEAFDVFKAAHPHVFIDCTFETMGGLQLIDYSMLRHAEGNWLSNFNEPDQQNDLRVRQMAWWRSPAMPATSLVIGNPKLADAGFEMHLKSLAGSLPIVLGDTRVMSAKAVALSRSYADFFRRMQARHDVFSFRQDLPGFGEPAEGEWDGFQRLNTDTGSGGIVGVFRHGSVDATRRVRLWLLDAARRYAVRTMRGDTLAQGSGESLMTKGFEVSLDERYDGILCEVTATA